ncbi:hypothetical protein [Kitasatospora griseola]|uniref:hypothetical protein n=1 Tax=Kitasatospora griseola TaxID=2064 RepID=UPI00342583C3
MRTARERGIASAGTRASGRCCRQDLQQLGVLVAAAVLLDATLIRLVVVRP